MKGSQQLTINGRFLSQRVTGVQRYAREIVAELDSLVDAERRVSAEIVVPPAVTFETALAAIRLARTRVGGGPLWDQLVLPIYRRGALLSLCNSGPVFAPHHIICIHDLNVVLAPESYSRAFRAYYRAVLPLLTRRAAHVATVSAFSARMLSEHGFCPLDKISVIPNGCEHVFRWAPQRSKYSVSGAHPRPFVFVLGSKARHKNVEILFAIAADLDALEIDIVVAGAAGHTFSSLDQRELPNNVRMLGFVTDDDLAALYQSALCFAFPSLTEGFGLPALEALALGCPVIVSAAASLPEVCGDAALYADPKSPKAWLNQIRRLHADPALARTLKAKGPLQAARFSWAKSAQKYLELIRSLGI